MSQIKNSVCFTTRCNFDYKM